MSRTAYPSASRRHSRRSADSCARPRSAAPASRTSLLEFDWGTNMTFAVQDVRDQLDGVFLPDDAERPLILRYDPNLDPILRIGVRPADEDMDKEASDPPALARGEEDQARARGRRGRRRHSGPRRPRGGDQGQRRPVQDGGARLDPGHDRQPTAAGEPERVGRTDPRGLDRLPRSHAQRVQDGRGDRGPGDRAPRRSGDPLARHRESSRARTPSAK